MKDQHALPVVLSHTASVSLAGYGRGENYYEQCVRVVLEEHRMHAFYLEHTVQGGV